MTYAELNAMRPVAAASRRGTAFRHFGKPDHVFICQYLLNYDKVELWGGRLERRYRLKPVGRYEGGHLFREGYVQRVWEFSGVVFLDDACAGAAVDAARLEARLLYEFLRGNVEGTGNAADLPNPLIELGENCATVVDGSTLAPSFPFGDPANEAFGDPDSQAFSPIDPRLTGTWHDSLFVLEEDTFRGTDAAYRYGRPYLPISFSLRQVPRQTVIT